MSLNNMLFDLIRKEANKKKYHLQVTYMLDGKNAISLIDNPDKKILSQHFYEMIHYKQINGNLIEMNRWAETSYLFGVNYNEFILSKLGYFMVQGTELLGIYDSIYDYKNAKFIVEKGIFDSVGVDNDVARAMNNHKNYLEEYNCFLGRFTLKSDNDTIVYVNPVTNDNLVYSFAPKEETYFALINTNGTIRGKKLFKGNNFSQIETIIDLNDYKSIKDFKEKRTKELNEIKRQIKELYFMKLQNTNQKTISPYLDDEVAKIISLKK